MKQKQKERNNLRSLKRTGFDISPEAIDKMSPEDIKHLINQFQIQQLELEMQNEELRNAQIKIEASRNQYYELFDHAPVSYFTLDKTGNILEYNLEGGKLLGLDHCKLTNSSIFQFIKKECKPTFYSLLNNVFANREKQVSQVWLQSKNGSSIYAQIESVAIEAENQERLYCRTAVIDLTPRKDAEDALKDNKLLTQKISEATPSIIYVYDVIRKNTTYINSGFRTVLGYDQQLKEGLSAEFISSIYHPDDLALLEERLLKFENMSEKEAIESEYRVKNARGEWVWLYSKEIVFKEDTVPGSRQILGVALDITRLKNIEIKLLEKNEELSKTNAELDRFVYSASHDLRAPLVSVTGLINVAKLENTDKNTSTYLNLMLKSINKLDNFIQDLISFSRNSRMTVENQIIDFEEMIGDILDGHKYFDGSEKIEKIIKINVSEDFYSDQTRLNIILSNLISNAIRYHNYSKEEQFIIISVTAEGGKAIIEVRDNGQGIGEEHLDKIFDVFYRASPLKTGSGLGLYIVKEAINKLQGKISLKSTINLGSCFTVEIPNQLPENINIQKNTIEVSQIPIDFKE